MERLEQQFAFLREIDKEKMIGRQTYLTDAVRKENDAEHAWHMAIMTLLLSEYANEEIDVLRTISMLLIHDIVEIDAGDTYAYDMEAKKTQRQREERAAERIFGMLPSDQREKMRTLWEEFEACETKEAKFARSMDNIQPMMLNAATDGKAWQERADISFYCNIRTKAFYSVRVRATGNSRGDKRETGTSFQKSYKP